jgi:hypothetical protein
MTGWIRLHRQLADHPIWTGERFARGQAWADLLMMAAFADHVLAKGNRSLEVKRGQVLHSQVALARRWRWDRETVRRFFRFIESLNMCRIETSKATDTGYTLITIMNYELFQRDQEGTREPVPASDAPSGATSDPASMPHPCPIDATRHKKGNKGKKGDPLSSASGLTLEQYLYGLPAEGQEILRQTVQSLATTRRSGKVAASVLDALAGKLARHPEAAVLAGCRIYLERDYAGEGKDEAYLLGIVRGEAKRMNGGSGTEGPRPMLPSPPAKTPGQRAIERALAEQQATAEGRP